MLPDKKLSFQLENLPKFTGSCPNDKTIGFCAGFFSITCRQIFAEFEQLTLSSLDNLAQIADRPFDEESHATSQTDESNFRSATIPFCAELSASSNHMKRDLQFLPKEIFIFSWVSVGDTSASLFGLGLPAHFVRLKKLQ